MATAGSVATAEAYASYSARPADHLAADLESFAALLRKWQGAQNLVSRETLNTLWPRHIADSLQVLKLIRPADRSFLDLGSGGGFPAIPLAIALKGRAGLRFVLVESNGRKASFLRTAARELRLAVEVESRRAEQIDSRETIPDVVTSRALASLPSLLELAAPFFGAETRGIFHKGRDHGDEIAESRARWHFDVLMLPSDTSADGVLLEISHLRSRTK